jgi:acyl-coenzyme A synthetase/AMP-(fatty) acid ligase
LRTLAFLLFDHIAGLDTLFYTLRNGGTLVFTDRRDPAAILALIAEKRVEVLPTSPSFLRLLCASAQTLRSDLSSLKVITYGSEQMDASTLERVNEYFPTAEILQKYGTTELGSPRTVSRSRNSLWLKFSGNAPQYKVVDGILWLRCEGTMLGYINAPSPHQESGWYCTGDLVEVDGEWLRFRGRADEVIKVGAEKVSPSEVERVIRELEFVKEVRVSGEPHPLMGHVITAQIAIETERPAVEVAAAIRRLCRRRLGAHHVPVKLTVVPRGTLEVLGYRLKLQRPRVAS